ncbi:MAG TPA: SRPBCC domain-containing protein, partial [Miltoncostaeaceae bacterium]|nr:SRPBCC domain-containing protein [Miltoncostaeaceae bacterium]
MTSGAPGLERAVVERVIAAPHDRVYALLTSAEGWLRWQGVEAEVDPRPGGTLRVNVEGDGFAVGRFEELVPRRRVVFTWRWEAAGHPIPAGSSEVEIDLIPDGEGTRLRPDPHGRRARLPRPRRGR